MHDPHDSSAWSPSRANAARAAKRRRSPVPRIEVVGLAGLFLALVFFLIGDPTPRHSKATASLPLATTASPQPSALREDAIRLTVTRDGYLFFRDQEVETDELPGLIQDSLRHGSEKKVFLLADSHAKTGDVNAIVDLIRRAGVSDVVILAGRREQ